MNRAATPARPRGLSTAGRRHGPRRGGFGGTLVGVFIGMIIGVGLAAAVAFYVLRAGNPYQPSVANSGAREPAREPAKGGRAADAASDRPRFDFYKILPGAEEPRVQARAPDRAPPDKAAAPERPAPPDKAVGRLEDRPAADRGAGNAADKPPEKPAEPPPRAPRSAERIWLQAGSFATEGDAESLKAKLAMAGLEATLQPATLPDKSVRYRVRLGPYDNVDELNRIKGDLARQGVDAAVIR